MYFGKFILLWGLVQYSPYFGCYNFCLALHVMLVWSDIIVQF